MSRYIYVVNRSAVGCVFLWSNFDRTRDVTFEYHHADKHINLFVLQLFKPGEFEKLENLDNRCLSCHPSDLVLSPIKSSHVCQNRESKVYTSDCCPSLSSDSMLHDIAQLNCVCV